MITLILGVFHHFCKSARSASRQCENFMASLHSDGSATYLLIIWVEKYTFCNEIETKTIYLNCFTKYTLTIFSIDYIRKNDNFNVCSKHWFWAHVRTVLPYNSGE